MYFNPRFGNFGMLVLPFGLGAFCAGIYTALYTCFHILSYIWSKAADALATHIPPHIPVAHLSWFYIDTNMMLFVVIAVMIMTFTTIILGQRISETRLSTSAFISYFALFGFIAPLWLVRAAWGTARSQESRWR